jgi:hypothetical protein
MTEDPINQGNMIETTDCLEAVGVFRGWKNFFFLILFICLLLAQAAFWLVDLGFVGVNPESEASTTVAEQGETRLVEEAARKTAVDANEAPKLGPTEAKARPAFLAKLKPEHTRRTVELVNGVLIVAAALYCLAMFFSLMVSLIGRLGGINQISRAFFLSLIMLVLVIPWQKLLGASVVGVVYTPTELADWLPTKASSMLNMALYYLRFSGYWLVVMLLLLMSQMRSARWTNAILRRLEII